MFKLNKRTMGLPAIMFATCLLLSFNKSNGMSAHFGPSSFLLTNKSISRVIMRPLRHVSSTLISGTFFTVEYILKKYRFNKVMNEAKKENVSPFFIARKYGYFKIVEELLEKPK
ncbi:hypothetical protein ACFLYU_01685 [Candidatus Dependentiae bacterium]